MLSPEGGSDGKNKFTSVAGIELKISLVIPEITDEHSRQVVDALLSLLEGVEQVRFRPELGVVEVAGDFSPLTIERVLEQAGFPVREVVGIQI